jgi:membrane protein DedA with SNARE-associated domain
VDIINEFILQAAASPWLLLVMFGVAVVDGFFPPVPSETVLVAAAAVAGSTGAFPTVVLLCLVAAIGATIGDNIAYGIGRSVGTTRFGWMRGARFSAAFARTRSTLERRGAPLILGARYIPVGRGAVNMAAGALRYPWRRFLPLSALGGAAWAVYSAALGILAGHWLEDQPLFSAALGVAFALVIGLIIDRVAAARRRRAEAAAPDPAPAETAAESPRGLAHDRGGWRTLEGVKN